MWVLKYKSVRKHLRSIYTLVLEIIFLLLVEIALRIVLATCSIAVSIERKFLT